MGFVVVASHPTEGTRRVELDGEACIGRGPNVHLVLPTESISRQHARLAEHADRVIVSDLQSSHGTGSTAVGSVRLRSCTRATGSGSAAGR